MSVHLQVLGKQGVVTDEAQGHLTDVNLHQGIRDFWRHQRGERERG